MRLLQGKIKTCRRCKTTYLLSEFELCPRCRKNEKIASDVHELLIPSDSKTIAQSVKRHRLLAPYTKYEKQHFDLHHKIENEYTRCHKAGIIDMNDIISWCYQDISLAPILREFWLKSYGTIALYPSFTRLAIIFEKQGDLENAVAVCRESIVLGLNLSDMPKRLDRLSKKIEKLQRI